MDKLDAEYEYPSSTSANRKVLKVTKGTRNTGVVLVGKLKSNGAIWVFTHSDVHWSNRGCILKNCYFLDWHKSACDKTKFWLNSKTMALSIKLIINWVSNEKIITHEYI